MNSAALAPPAPVLASAVAARLRGLGVDHVTTTPDFVQVALHQQLDARDSGIATLYCANENQALQMATGLIIGGRRPVVLMQNQGLYNAVNTLRACGLDAGMPLVMLVGQFGREFGNVGRDPRQSRRRMVNLLLPVLDALGVHHGLLESPADLGVIDAAWQHAWSHRAPAVVVVGQHLAWD